MDVEEGRALLKKIATQQPLSPKEKNFRIAGVITEYVQEKIGVRIIVVGGLSVEVYTDGGYMTNDIDFVGENHAAIMTCIEELGFESLNRYNKNILGGGVMRFHEQLNTLVEVPANTLKDADIERITKKETPDGLTVWLIGIEDIIADRIRAATHYKEKIHIKFIIEMIEKNKMNIDFSYLLRILSSEEATLLYDVLAVLSNSADGETQLTKIRTEMTDEKYSSDKFYKIHSDLENLILFKIGKTDYIGFTTYPFLNLYVYQEEEEEFTVVDPTREELSLQEVAEWPSNPEKTNGYSLEPFVAIITDILDGPIQ